MAMPLYRLSRIALGAAFILPLLLQCEDAAAATKKARRVVAPQPASAAQAASAPQPASAPASTWVPEIPPIPALDVINEPRDYVANKFVALMSGLDNFFGNDRNFQESNDSVLQIDMTRVMGYTGEHRFVWQGKAKLHLPNAEKSLHLMIESDADKNTANASNQVQVSQPSSNTKAPSSYAFGLRHEYKTDDDRWHFGTDGGLKFAGLSTSPFLRARGSYGMPLELWRMKVAETVFWFNSTGVGETTQLDFERPLSDPYLFRATTSATWLNNRQNFDLRQDLSLFETVSGSTAMLYQASAIGTSDASLQARVTDYVLLMLYRHRLHRDWMYLEISPQLHFPLQRNFTPSGMLVVRLEMLFDRSQ